jgi:hypothetical protein
MHVESPSVVAFWYSGARFDAGSYAWRIASERLTIDEVFARVAAPRFMAAQPAPPKELTNETAP